MHDKGIVSPSVQEDERQFETALRPSRLDDFAGQAKVKEILKIAIEAARQRGEAMDHVLLYGPPGLGKTTLANIIAQELGVGITQTSGPVLQKKLDLVGILSNIHEREVFFVDEIHRLQPDVEEMIYSALEDFRMDILVGTGPGARTVAMDIKRFTAIGATTRQGLISAPLRGRFGLVLRLNHYDVEELTRIVERSARLLSTRNRPRRCGGDRAPQPRNASHRQSTAAPRAGLRAGARRRMGQVAGGTSRARSAGSGPLRAR